MRNVTQNVVKYSSKNRLNSPIKSTNNTYLKNIINDEKLGTFHLECKQTCAVFFQVFVFIQFDLVRFHSLDICQSIYTHSNNYISVFWMKMSVSVQFPPDIANCKYCGFSCHGNFFSKSPFITFEQRKIHSHFVFIHTSSELILFVKN